jgi:polyisoprenoid-binding protein YceI
MKRSYIHLLPVILFSISGHNLIFAQSYVLDVEKSKISWTGWKQLFGRTGTQTGNLKFRSGSFSEKDGTFVVANLIMDMNSISHLNDGKVYTDNDVVTDLKSESCFYVEKYPTATFKLTKTEKSISPDNASSLIITGTLTIKGIKKTISFPATVTRDKSSLLITAAFQISRKAYDIDLEPFLIPIGGDKMVRDNIDVTVEILALPQS